MEIREEKKVLWFDVETTGLSAYHNDIVELAYQLQVGNEIVQERCVCMAPFDITKVQDKALAIHNRTVEEIAEYPSPTEVYQLVLQDWGKWVNKFDKKDKMYVAGYNVGFDLEFLVQHAKKCNDKYLGSWINYKRLDVLDLVYRLDFEGVINLPNNKLSTVAQYFGVEIQAHNALSDINATRQLNDILMKLLKEGRYER